MDKNLTFTLIDSVENFSFEGGPSSQPASSLTHMNIFLLNNHPDYQYEYLYRHINKGEGGFEEWNDQLKSLLLRLAARLEKEGSFTPADSFQNVQSLQQSEKSWLKEHTEQRALSQSRKGTLGLLKEFSFPLDEAINTCREFERWTALGYLQFKIGAYKEVGKTFSDVFKNGVSQAISNNTISPTTEILFAFDVFFTELIHALKKDKENIGDHLVEFWIDIFESYGRLSIEADTRKKTLDDQSSNPDPNIVHSYQVVFEVQKLLKEFVIQRLLDSILPTLPSERFKELIGAVLESSKEASLLLPAMKQLTSTMEHKKHQYHSVTEMLSTDYCDINKEVPGPRATYCHQVVGKKSKVWGGGCEVLCILTQEIEELLSTSEEIKEESPIFDVELSGLASKIVKKSMRLFSSSKEKSPKKKPSKSISSYFKKTLLPVSDSFGSLNSLFSVFSSQRDKKSSKTVQSAENSETTISLGWCRFCNQEMLDYYNLYLTLQDRKKERQTFEASKTNSKSEDKPNPSNGSNLISHENDFNSDSIENAVFLDKMAEFDLKKDPFFSYNSRVYNLKVFDFGEENEG